MTNLLEQGAWKLKAIACVYVCCMIACSQQDQSSLFSPVQIERSSIDFTNTITETDSFNILTHEFMYNGGGVGVGDFNQDGLFDLYFAGNEVSNKLYLNKGAFVFEDITEKAGVAAADIWSSGISIVDINQDGLSDIYVSATFRKDKAQRTNKLFVNQGNDANGIPSFKEQASTYGLADTSYTTHTYFFDYDRDGDLDAFLLNDKLFRPRSTTDLKLLMDGGEATVDKLLMNNGQGRFEDVSEDAGIRFPGFGLGAAIYDVNADGYLDIYVSNDFISNDLLYVNQQDGTFENQLDKYFKHHSFSSMGIDVSDLNGDGVEDVMTLDMLPEDRARTKRTYSFQKYQFYDLMEETGYTMQYNRNSLHLSNPSARYSELSQLAGVDGTEWSWSVLFADLDNDALKDIAITNGYPRDITDMDFTDYNTGLSRMMATQEKLLAQIPVVKVHNYMFQNQGNYSFEDVSAAWGIDQPSFSNGAAVVDLDNDGDLDYVVNNINDPATILENKSAQLVANNFLRIRLNGEVGNQDALGAKIRLFWDNTQATALHVPQRGYISSIEPVIHFGLGQAEKIDSVLIDWPDGSRSVHLDLAVNTLHLLKKEGQGLSPVNRHPKTESIFRSVNLEGFDFSHREAKFHDFNFQGLLPRLHSREGPAIAAGDLNGDGVDDLVLGNGSRSHTHVYLSQPGGGFAKQTLTDIYLSEDMGILIFDADLDGDNDVYVACGSTEFRSGSGYYHDKFYENDGSGQLSLQMDKIPQLPISTASISAADYDKDGDLDLFLAGRISPQSYPLPSNSYLLQNQGGSFAEVNENDAPDLNEIGMVSQGLWTDIDNDGWMDLLLVGEWMPITILRNREGKLRLEKDPVLAQTHGWWNSVSAADLDLDGDMDYVLGNQGLNNKVEVSSSHPLYIYAYDFDHNGSVDPIITAYYNDGYYPVHLKADLLRQLNMLKKKFSKFRAFSEAKIEDFIDKDTLRIAPKLKAELFASSILWNDETGFRLEALPMEAQFAPIYGTLCKDVDADGDPDILAIGNRYNTEVFEGRHDALNGLVLVNDGKQGFTKLSADKSGFIVDGDARALIQYIDREGAGRIIAGMNDSEPIIFSAHRGVEMRLVMPNTHEVKAMLTFKNGQTQLKELYWGSGFLSQSSRGFYVNPELLEKVDFYDQKGLTRTINY